MCNFCDDDGVSDEIKDNYESIAAPGLGLRRNDNNSDHDHSIIQRSSKDKRSSTISKPRKYTRRKKPFDGKAQILFEDHPLRESMRRRGFGSTKTKKNIIPKVFDPIPAELKKDSNNQKTGYKNFVIVSSPYSEVLNHGHKSICIPKYREKKKKSKEKYNDNDDDNENPGNQFVTDNYDGIVTSTSSVASTSSTCPHFLDQLRGIPITPSSTFTRPQSKLWDCYINRFARVFPTFSDAHNPFLEILIPASQSIPSIRSGLLALAGTFSDIESNDNSMHIEYVNQYNMAANEVREQIHQKVLLKNSLSESQINNENIFSINDVCALITLIVLLMMHDKLQGIRLDRLSSHLDAVYVVLANLKDIRLLLKNPIGLFSFKLFAFNDLIGSLMMNKKPLYFKFPNYINLLDDPFVKVLCGVLEYQEQIRISNGIRTTENCNNSSYNSTVFKINNTNINNIGSSNNNNYYFDREIDLELRRYSILDQIQQLDPTLNWLPSFISPIQTNILSSLPFEQHQCKLVAQVYINQLQLSMIPNSDNLKKFEISLNIAKLITEEISINSQFSVALVSGMVTSSYYLTMNNSKHYILKYREMLMKIAKRTGHRMFLPDNVPLYMN